MIGNGGRIFRFPVRPFPETYVPQDEKLPASVKKSVCLSEASLRILGSRQFFKYFGGRPSLLGPFVAMTKGRQAIFHTYRLV